MTLRSDDFATWHGDGSMGACAQGDGITGMA